MAQNSQACTGSSLGNIGTAHNCQGGGAGNTERGLDLGLRNSYAGLGSEHQVRHAKVRDGRLIEGKVPSWQYLQCMGAHPRAETSVGERETRQASSNGICPQSLSYMPGTFTPQPKLLCVTSLFPDAMCTFAAGTDLYCPYCLKEPPANSWCSINVQ